MNPLVRLGSLVLGLIRRAYDLAFYQGSLASYIEGSEMMLIINCAALPA